MTKDLNKNITDIQYNVLNLPSHIRNSMEYEYAADGTKLRMVHHINGEFQTIDYCGNAIYENGAPKILLNETGYYSFQDRKFHFYLKDHQGNVRLVADKDGKVEETNDYYPFGGLMSNSSASVQPYKYNGKELDKKEGVNLYDYGARMYDAALGRWHAVDSLTEKYYSFNPYNYCENNPIRYIDPDGNGWNEAWPFLKNSFSTSFSIGAQAKASAKILGTGVELGINGSSVKIGNGPLTVEKGVSVVIGPFSAENYTRAYEANSYTSVRESGYSVGFTVAKEDHKTTEIFDSRGKYFEKKGESKSSDISYTIDASAAVIVGIDISIDLSELLKFVKELFK